MSLLRVDNIQNRFLNSGPIIVGLTTIAGNLICSGITSITDGLVVSAASTTQTLNVLGTSGFRNNVFISPGNLTIESGDLTLTSGQFIGDGVRITGIVTEIVAGAGVSIIPANGKGSVTITVPLAGQAGYADTAGIATDVQGGSAGQILYQAGVDDTAFVGVGTTGFILQANFEGAPNWTEFTSINVAYADSAGISTDILGGTAGQLLFQSATDETDFVDAGNSGQVLISQGNLGPTFTDNLNLEVGFAEVAGVATNVSGGFITAFNFNVSGISTVGSALSVGGYLDVRDNINVEGIGTFVGFATFGSDVFVSGALTVTSLTVTDDDSGGGTLNVGILSVSNQAFFTGISTFDNGVDFNAGIDVTGISTFNNELQVGGGLTVTGISTFNNDVTIDGNLTLTGAASTFVAGITSVSQLLVSPGVSTFQGDATFNSNVGIGTTIANGAADPNNTSVLNVGVVTANFFFGDGSGLTNLDGVEIPNVLFVNKAGNDNNSGISAGEAKLTIKAALAAATEGTTIRVAAGQYTEDNPLVMPKEVSIDGDSLREVSIRPANVDQDLIYVTQSSYVGDVSFEGVLNADKAVIAFNPDEPAFITRGPYIRNCTNFVRDSIGMKIDGAHALGDTKAMNVDSYTQYNQGGIGVSVSNDGYAQLVSIFTICNDQSIVCTTGGQCDLTNSNSSFGRLGLVADGIGPTNFIGTITSATSADASTFTVDLSVDTHTITNALYDNNSGLTTITTSTDHGFNVGMSVTMKDMTFTCDSALPVTTFGITTANYTAATGIMTVQTSIENNFYVGASVTFSQLVFRCDSGGGPSTAFFPPLPGDGNGDARHVFDIIDIPSGQSISTEFVVNVGTSTITHDYMEGGNVSISTFAPFPSGAYGNIFTVDSVISNTQFTSYVGSSTLPHTYVSGGEVETFITRPFDGQVLYLDELYYTINSIIVTDGGSGYTTPPTVTIDAPTEDWGIRATAVANITDGSVTSIDMVSNGRGYTSIPSVAITGSATGTATSLPTYYVVSSSTPVVGGITTVTVTENIPYAVGVGSTVPFFRQSKILSSSHAFEYIGSGNTIGLAIPARGGVVIPENEIVNIDGGLVVFTSTDQAGNFKIGDGVTINQQDGSITGESYTRSLFANVTPLILALGGGNE